jgi:hypothetical protein
MTQWNQADPLENVISDEGWRESKRANQAFRDYAFMGVSRSLAALIKIYTKQTPERLQLPATKSLNTLKKWSQAFAWVERAERFDALQAEKTKAEYDTRRAKIMNDGLALAHERIAKLNEIFFRLYEDFQEEQNLWLPDKKGIGQAENFQVVDIVRFNSQLVDQMRATLDDIASEVGERVKNERIEQHSTNTAVNLYLPKKNDRDS